MYSGDLILVDLLVSVFFCSIAISTAGQFDVARNIICFFLKLLYFILLFFIHHSFTDWLSLVTSLQKEKKEGKKDKDDKEEESGKWSPLWVNWGFVGNLDLIQPCAPAPGPPCGPICSNEQVEKLLALVKPEIQTLKEKLNTVGWNKSRVIALTLNVLPTLTCARGKTTRLPAESFWSFWLPACQIDLRDHSATIWSIAF